MNDPTSAAGHGAARDVDDELARLASESRRREAVLKALAAELPAAVSRRSMLASLRGDLRRQLRRATRR